MIYVMYRCLNQFDDKNDQNVQLQLKMRKQPRGRPAKKGSKSTKSNNQSSSANSQSNPLSDRMSYMTQDEPEVKLEVFGQITKLVYPCFILITPNATLQFEQQILPRLKSLASKYQKDQARNFILDNLKAQQIYNITNALAIEDEQFWNDTLHSLIKLLVEELPKLPFKSKILLPQKTQFLDYTRLDALILLSSMLLGIMPIQPHESCVHFGELMTFRDKDSQEKIMKRRQKLKCLFAYFNIMMKNQHLFQEVIHIHRTYDKNRELFNPLKSYSKIPLKKVTIRYYKNTLSEELCGKAIITNHSSQCVGFNALKNGMNKQDILFSIFPELIMIKLLCPQTGFREAIIFYGARRFARYNGEFKSFLFEGQYPLQKPKVAQKTIIVSIDPANYNKYGPKQYTKMGVLREITKAYVGFNGPNLIEGKMPVSTGKWGCGANGGDQILKFLIQWIAASKANREMIYMVNNEQKIKAFQLLYQELCHLDGTELLSLIFEYCQKMQLRSFKTSLQDFLKYYS